MANKIGVYICTGCQIGENLDIDKLTAVANDEFKVPVCKTNNFFCGKEGVATIKEDIEKEELDGVVIAACSQRVNVHEFDFGPNVAVERANIREHVAWAMKPNDEDTDMAAEDYVRMYIAKVKKVKQLQPYEDKTNKTILIVGGGLTGMTAALEAANANYRVYLVEKSLSLGGHLGSLHKKVPTKPPYTKAHTPNIQAMIREIEKNENIRVLIDSQIEEISGQPGQFKVRLVQGGKTSNLTAGAIIQATGHKPYDANKLADEYGYGKFSNVVTSYEFEEMALKGEIARPSDGETPKSVAFIQCAGSRDKKHLPYCSSTCCLTSLKQATYVRENNGDSKAYILYRDIRTPGQYENYYTEVQQDDGIFLTKGDINGVAETDDHNLLVSVDNSLLGDSVDVKADLVVLAVGMVPNAPEKNYSKLQPVTVDKVPDIPEEESILHLTYRKGKDIPQLKYGFPDSNFICFPYESARTAIYAAGTVRQPMDELTAIQDACGAALKAIQAVEQIDKGAALHPRAGDLSYPDFQLTRCTQCKRCTEECPFGALDEDEKGTPKPNPNRCRRCGVCLGACPERIVSFANYSVDMISTMIRACEIPEEDEEKPRILALVCENDAYPAIDIAGMHRFQYDSSFRIIPVRCLGSVNVAWIKDALAEGYDGILMIGCKHGDDYQCHFIKGSELCEKRGENIQEALEKLVLEPERVKIVQLALADYHKVPEIFAEFMEEINELEPNPYKDL